MSKLFRDQKERPIERAVWWIEWAIRNPNAHYIKSPVLELGSIKGNCYDLIAFLVLTPLLLYLILTRLFKFLVQMSSKRNISLKNKELVKKSL